MKKIAILGTGMVGSTIGSKLIQLGFEVKMGSRTSDNEKASEWVKTNGIRATQGTFGEASDFAEIVINCTKGEHSLAVIKAAGVDKLKGKLFIDISNPLDFSKGMPPTLISEFSNTNSLGESIQAFLPETKVVKTLNIVNCDVMVDASKYSIEPTMFVAGNDIEAKKNTIELLNQFGWKDIIDLGSITHARSMEMMLPIWLSVYMATKNANFAFKVTR